MVSNQPFFGSPSAFTGTSSSPPSPNPSQPFTVLTIAPHILPGKALIRSHFSDTHLPTPSKNFAIRSPPIHPNIAPTTAPITPPTTVPITGTNEPIPAPISAHFPIFLKAPLNPLSTPPNAPPRAPETFDVPHSSDFSIPAIPSLTIMATPAAIAAGPITFANFGLLKALEAPDHNLPIPALAPPPTIWAIIAGSVAHAGIPKPAIRPPPILLNNPPFFFLPFFLPTNGILLSISPSLSTEVSTVSGSKSSVC